jgi:hypothetical protein
MTTNQEQAGAWIFSGNCPPILMMNYRRTFAQSFAGMWGPALIVKSSLLHFGTRSHYAGITNLPRFPRRIEPGSG